MTAYENHHKYFLIVENSRDIINTYLFTHIFTHHFFEMSDYSISVTAEVNKTQDPDKDQPAKLKGKKGIDRE